MRHVFELYFLVVTGMMTIGHSTLELEAFLCALRENGCSTLVDVRRYPGSKRYPQFGQERLFASLEVAGIRGVWRVGGWVGAELRGKTASIPRGGMRVFVGMRITCRRRSSPLRSTG